MMEWHTYEAQTFGFPSSNLGTGTMPFWWNGRHNEFKPRYPYGCAGSSPAKGTICEYGEKVDTLVLGTSALRAGSNPATRTNNAV